MTFGSTLVLSLVAACSGPTGGGPDDAADTDSTTTDDTGGPTGPFVETTDHGDGTFTTVVRATSLVDSVYLSFADGEVAVPDPAISTTWDIAFRREHVRLNSGSSGPGAVDAAVLDGIAFESIRWAPIAGYAVDAPGDADGDMLEDEVFATWFDYVYEEHRLYPADRRYVVRTPAGAVRMRFDTYYAATDGNSGYPTFTWSWLEEGGPLSGTAPDAATFDCSELTQWSYLSVREWVALDPPEPATSDDWDLGLQWDQVSLNGGVSGPGGLTAATLTMPFAAVTSVPASGFVADAPDADADGVPERALVGAFVSDGAGGFVAAPVTFVIARPDGTHDKLAFTTWSTTTPATPSFQVAPLPD